MATLADSIGSEKHRTNGNRQMHDERTVAASQTTLRNTATQNNALIEDTATALVTPEGHKRTKRTDNRLHDMLQALVNNIFDESLHSVKLGKLFPSKT